LLLLCGTLFLSSVTLALYLRHNSLRHWQIAVSCLSVPLLVLLIMLAKPGLHGIPDDRCPSYGDGRVEFRLLSTPGKIPVDPARPFGDSWMILTVEAQSLWGQLPHLCRISLQSEEGRRLYKLFRMSSEVIASQVNRDGSTELLFTFGNIEQVPTMRPSGRGSGGTPTEKTGPPERAQGV
jgi:hypothetical protein